MGLFKENNYFEYGGPSPRKGYLHKVKSDAYQKGKLWVHEVKEYRYSHSYIYKPWYSREKILCHKYVFQRRWEEKPDGSKV